MNELVHGELRVPCPDGWRDASSVLLLGPPVEGYSPSLHLARDPRPGQLDAKAYGQAQLEPLRQKLGDHGYVVEEEGVAEIGRRIAYRRIHRFREPVQQIEVTQIQVHVIVGEQAITLTATDRTDQFPRTRPQLVQALQGCQVIDTAKGTRAGG